MTTAAPASFYDTDLADRDSLALIPLERSPWLPLYTEALRWLPVRPIVDLGCGTGRFARLLADHGFTAYEGVDFSPAATAEARRYVPEPGFRFRVTDLADWQPAPGSSNTIYVTLETLEHLDDDIDLLRRIPNGHQLLLSVPSYDSAGHVRTFPHLADVFARYQPLLDFHAWRALDMGSIGRRIHLCDTTRRADSWS